MSSVALLQLCVNDAQSHRKNDRHIIGVCGLPIKNHLSHRRSDDSFLGVGVDIGRSRPSTIYVGLGGEYERNLMKLVRSDRESVDYINDIKSVILYIATKNKRFMFSSTTH